MRVVLPRKDFSRALSLISKAVRSHAGPFGWVKLKTFERLLMLQATNGEMFLTLQIQAEIREEGEVCVEATELLQAVKPLIKPEHVELYIDSSENNLAVKAGNLTQLLALKPAELFPDFPEPQFQASIPTTTLIQGIEKTGFAVDQKNRGVLAHLFIDGRWNHLRFVGSDGHRLAVLKYDYAFDLKVKLYHKSLKLLKELLKLSRDTGEVLIGCGESKLAYLTNKSVRFTYLSNGSWTIAIREFEGRYPNYDAVVPPFDIYDVVVEVPVEDLNNALKSFTELDKITLEFTDKGLWLKAHDREVLVQAQVYGDIFSIDFDPKKLKEFTDAVGAYTYIEAMFKNSDETPALFKVDNNYLYLVMPLIRKKEY